MDCKNMAFVKKNKKKSIVGDPQSQADSQLNRYPNDPLAKRASKCESANEEVCTPNPLQCSD